MRNLLYFILFLSLTISAHSQTIEIEGARKHVRTSGDIGTILLSVAGVTAVLIQQDWEGLKQGALAGITTLGVTYGLKYLIKKDRPDHSDRHSFPSMHSATSFAAATFIQRRYGWKWGLPAYVLSTYVGWSRIYGKKHDCWDVLAGAAIGIGSSYLFTRPFAKRHNLTIAPIADNHHYGIHASLSF